MMRRFGLPLLPAIIGVILGPFAEEEMRQSLQISNGAISGLFEPISIVVYVIVALILLWPLVRRVLPRKAVLPVLDEAVHEIEEAHHHHGMTTAVSVEQHVPTSRSRAHDDEHPAPRGTEDPPAPPDGRDR
jgi:putative tricarboxylic transport membrane protein